MKVKFSGNVIYIGPPVCGELDLHDSLSQDDRYRIIFNYVKNEILNNLNRGHFITQILDYWEE